MKNYIEELEQELASNSYRADQHEKNEMVIKTSRVLEIIGESHEKAIQSAKKEAVEERIKKIDDYGDKLVREGAEEQSDYYMGELNAVSRIKELIERKQTL